MITELDLSGLDLGQIQAFLVSAQTSNFTKAAELLHLTQPVISKRIASLEGKLGFQLFIRWRRTIRLTPAGKILATAWKDLLNHVMAPINRAAASQRGFTQHLTIGYCANAHMYQIGDHFLRSYPTVNLSFVQAQYPELQSKLLSGELDLVFYGTFGQKDFSCRPFRCRVLKTFPLIACVLPTNPLARMKTISLGDLREQDFIMLSPLIAPARLSYMTEQCVRSRFTPRVSFYAEDTTALVMNLRDSHSVFITDKHCTVVDTQRVDLAFLEITDASAGALVAWNEETETEMTHLFVEKSAEYWERVQ